MEEWRDIPGYESLYQVSNQGRVRRLSGTIKHPTGSEKRWEGRILKPQSNCGGYLHVRLSKDGVINLFLVHRLVAESFIENKDHKPQVNHIDGNKKNNKVNNLEWSTSKENIAHSLDNGLRHQDSRSKKVIRSDGEVFNSINEAARSSSTSHGNVKMVINGARKSAKGFSFRFAED